MISRLRLAAVLALSTLAACSGSSATSGTSAPAPRAASAAAAAKPFEYAATTGQYRFISESKAIQSAGGQSRETTQSSNRLMTMVLVRSGPDTITVTMTIDSISGTAPMGMPVVGIDKLPGVKFIAKVAPNGSFYSVTGPSETENLLASTMTDEAGRALPRLKATLATGTTWTDTIKDKVKSGPLTLDREVVTTFTVNGDTTVGGVASWKIGRTMVMKGSGKGNMGGQDFSLENTGTGSGVLIMSKAGVLIGGSAEEKTIGVVTAAMGQIDLNQSATTKFTKVK